ncbi:glycoside hydrolase family 95 protein [Pedobacter frigoris]|uniref:glycoside hydrolase family 95 protein n=1 Tax=Pedobacter frigoris TaxID=2571272 RepID=UPI00292E58BF|nr:glycoside hydrolase family 95 protein [Pedobacter frigoris]
MPFTYLKAQSNYQNKIWFKAPANSQIKDNPNGWVNDMEWLKAIPIGNGNLGAMVFGDVNQDRIQLNELSLWSGSQDDNDNPEASKYLSEIRSLLFQGKYKEATALTNKTQIAKGKGSGHGNGANVPFGCFQTLGDLRLNFGKSDSYKNYYRELDLINGITTTRFNQNGIDFTREVFASHPDKAIIIHLTANKSNSISFKLTLDRPERFTTAIEGNSLLMYGTLDNGKGGEGMKYKTYVTPQLNGGKLLKNGNQLQIENANSVTLIITAKTNYRQHYPDYINTGYEQELASITKKATAKKYIDLKKSHIKDFSGFMGRVDFNLASSANDLPTNELMAKNFLTKNEQAIYPLYFQFGRYLLLSSSRTGGLPANLQGIWANKIQTPWNGDYHTDINVQMNYWPAEVTNLSESHVPLIDLISSLSVPGKKTAATQYQMKGWALHPITNVWGYTSPGESASWGMHIGAGAWIAQHLWEHYAFTKDKAYLAKIYPLLKDASQFYLDWLVKDPKTGKLVSGPSPSPENSFKAPDGSTAQISMGPAHDQQVIFNLFGNTLQSSDILNIKDKAFINHLTDAKNNLAMSKIGSDGRLMEWAEEFKEAEPKHRHLSHLFALYPGNEITVYKTPELADAVKKSLEARGDGGVGWTFAWKIALWARLHDGDRALSILNNHLRPTGDVDTKYDSGGGTYYNMFDACPPFQIDGNFGVIAGMAEMLLQSHEDFIELLPAVPKAWKDGHIKGLVARGNFVIDLQWQNGKIVSGFIKNKTGGKCKIKYGDQILDFNVPAGKTLNFAQSFK